MPEVPSPLIDILSEDSFNAEHIPGAVNICVYETAFLDKFRAAFPDTSARLTIYGWDDSTREAQAALEKLTAAGYENVAAIPGGFSGWKARKGAIQKGEGSTRPASGRYLIDTSASIIRWTGRNLFNFHHGTLAFASGFVEIKNGALTDGRFIVDMRSIHCDDLAHSPMHEILIAHLQGDDFFDVANHPAAECVITSANQLGGATPGVPNFRLRGRFTLRGITREIEFPAVIAERPEGGYSAQAAIDINRTQWGSIYGSGKFFARLGQHVVNDEIHLHLKVQTAPTLES